MKGPPVDPGHGSVEEVVAVLESQGVPCRDSRPAQLQPITEQAVECRFAPDGSTVLLVHFFDVAGSQAFEAQLRQAGSQGVFADTWAARTESAAAADLLARALRHRSST